MPVLADIFSAGNTLKRRMKDFAANPGAFLETEVNYRNQKAGEFNTLQDLATQGDINKMRGLPVTPDQQAAELRLRDIVAGAYNPIGMTAYHGSPYLFPRFDPKRMGSGEGNQSYGVGAGYTSEGRPVAESYRASIAALKRNAKQGNQEVTIGGKSVNWDNPEEVAAFELTRHAGDRQAAADFHARTFLGGENNPAVKLLRSNQKLPKVDMPGYLYKGDIPDEIIPKFLDYDAPLKNQSREVQTLAKSLGMDLEDLGGDLLGKVGKNVKGTLQMQDAGIKGIKYLDQGSRGQGKGTSNFIPFSPDDFKIQEINDEPLEAWLKSGRLQVDESDPLMQFLGQK